MNRLHPKKGDTVCVPSDGNRLECVGVVTYVGTDLQTNLMGIPYVWMNVRRCGDNHSSVWASHCLGYRIDCN